MLPTITLGNAEVSRLVMGGNIISGTSHISPEMDKEMQEYYTMPNIQKAFDTCWENGINTVQLRMDAHIIRALMEHRLNGGKLNWIAQTAPEYRSLENNLRMAAKIGPIAVYFHGSIVDDLYAKGEIQQIKDSLKTMRMLGVPVGLCTHIPEVLLRAEQEEWGADWYMACVYNIMKKGHVSSSVTGKFINDETYDTQDPPAMYQAIRQTPKPCFAFKILGASRRCETDADREAAFTEAYTSIKKTDACIVGFFQKYSDQITQNAAYVKKILA
jgi:hypothetical protein